MLKEIQDNYKKWKELFQINLNDAIIINNDFIDKNLSKNKEYMSNSNQDSYNYFTKTEQLLTEIKQLKSKWIVGSNFLKNNNSANNNSMNNNQQIKEFAMIQNNSIIWNCEW